MLIGFLMALAVGLVAWYLLKNARGTSNGQNGGSGNGTDSGGSSEQV